MKTYNEYDYNIASYVFNFETKEDYLNYRTLWRQAYAELSSQIRNIKLEIKHRQRTGDYRIAYLQIMLANFREKATEMLIERQASKVWSEMMYQKSRLLAA